MVELYSELRKDPLRGEWVLIAPHPQREHLANIPREDWPQTADAVFADPEGAGAQVLWSRCQAIPDHEEIVIRVIANRHPLYRVEYKDGVDEMGVYRRMSGLGAHEIFIESDRPADSLLTMSEAHYSMVLEALQERIKDLKRDFRLKSFSFFREWACGKTPPQVHPHSQMVVSSIVPAGLERELALALQYHKENGRCPVCAMIEQEIAEDARVVFRSERIAAYCPYASRAPFEVHIAPREHQACFSREPMEMLSQLADAIKSVALRLDRALPGWMLVMALRTKPAIPDDTRQDKLADQAYHWRVEFIPRPPGDSLWAERTGSPIIHTPPEHAAAWLRELGASA
ncbi:MAG: hypothetical protein GC154_02995 [bacterium]|nr:hypothetical protein [bacterium]